MNADHENGPRVVIEYCPKCRWLLRAAWIAQELLTTFENELAEGYRAHFSPSTMNSSDRIRM